MSWQAEGGLDDCEQPSQISVSSRIYVNKKEKQRSGLAAGRSLEPQQSLDKCLASTNFESELPELPSLERPGEFPKTRRTMVDEFKLGSLQPLNYNTATEQRTDSLHTVIANLTAQMAALEQNQISLQQRFFNTIETLKEDIAARTNRNRDMRIKIEQLRKELADRRSEVRQLIHYVKSQHRHHQNEYMPRPDTQHSPVARVDTLRHFQSEKQLASLEKQSMKQSTSGEERKVKMINGRRVYIREKSDSSKQWRN